MHKYINKNELIDITTQINNIINLLNNNDIMNKYQEPIH